MASSQNSGSRSVDSEKIPLSRKLYPASFLSAAANVPWAGGTGEAASLSPLDKYILERAVHPRLPPPLHELLEATVEKTGLFLLFSSENSFL